MFLYMAVKLGIAQVKAIRCIDGVWEQGAEENIWT
jgi:hypothetical protein